MNELEQFLKILQGINLLTPAIANVATVFKRGREEGKDDEAIKAEAQEVVSRVIAKGEQQMSNQP